ncbi:MAG TPA: sigma-70 family RNA polymerase sigma factor [Chloroflexota bacterium]|nr:sigma-70 family RNA polymerase sigma factor [Chloroflexota bacterium]
MPIPDSVTHEGKGFRGFSEFFDRYARELAAAVALATGDIATAEDAIQEAMASAYSRWDRVSRMGRPDIWVLRVAQRKAIDTWRKRRREDALDRASTSASVPDVVQRLWVTWGLEHLTAEDRLLVILRHRDSLSVDEIAVALGKPPNTVAVALKRARRRLRNLLKETDQ